MTVGGSPDDCGALGLVLQRAAAGVGTAAGSVASARGAASCWRGAGGDAWRAAEQRQQAAAKDLAAALQATGNALTAFAAALAEAQALAATALRHARDAGLRVDPLGGIAPVRVPYGPFTSPEQQEQARRAAQQAHARQELLRQLASAQEAERAAHDTLLRALTALDPPRQVVGPAVPGRAPASAARPAPGWNDWVDLGTGLVLAPGQALERATQQARDRALFAKQVKATTRHGSAEQRQAARRAWKEALRSFREAQRAADAQRVTVSRLQPVGGWLGQLGRPLSGGIPVVRSVPGVSVLMTGGGIAHDTNRGMDPALAVTKNVSSTAAGMAAGAVATGATAAVFTGGVVVLGPVLVGVAAGAAVGYGTGYVIEHYGDDVAEAVQGLAGQAENLATKVWGKIT